MLEGWQLYEAASKATNQKKLAAALGVSLQHSYALTRDPVELDAPCRTDIDRITNVVEMLAAHPNAKPALILFRMYFKELFARVIDRETPHPLTPETVLLEAQEMCAEFSDVLRECRPGFCPDRLSIQAAEMIARLERVVQMAEQTDDVKPIGRQMMKRGA